MKILISGASGYLGSHLAKELSKEHQVFALLRKASSRKRLEGLSVKTVNYDTEHDLELIFVEYTPDIIINTAALYGRKDESLSALVEANIAFPARLLSLATKYNTKAFIHTGTSLPSEVSLYAQTKNSFVSLACLSKELAHKRTNGEVLKFIDVALEHFYGPDDDLSKFTSFVIDACIKGNKLELTEGLQKRDFIYIEDVVSAYKILISNIHKLKDIETISVGSGFAPSVQEFVKLVHSCCHSTSSLDFGAVKMRDGELMYSCANTLRLKQLGWENHFSLEQGIHATLKREQS